MQGRQWYMPAWGDLSCLHWRRNSDCREGEKRQIGIHLDIMANWVMADSSDWQPDLEKECFCLATYIKVGLFSHAGKAKGQNESKPVNPFLGMTAICIPYR